MALATLLAPVTAVRADGPVASAPDHAPSLRVEAIGGGHFVGSGTNLGVAAGPGASAGAKNNALLGLRAGFGLGPWAAAEVELYGMRTPDRTYDVRADIIAYRLNLLAYVLAGPVRPFMLVGAGAIEVATTHADGNVGLVRDRDAEFHIGLGFDYAIGRYLSLRADGRLVEMPGKQVWSTSSDFEVMAGLGVRFGAPDSAGPADAPAGSAAPADLPAPSPLAPAAVAAPKVAAPSGDAAPASAASAPPAPPAPMNPPPTPAVEPAPKPPAAAAAQGGMVLTVPPAATDQIPAVKELLPRAKEIHFEGSTSKLSLTSLPLIGQLAEALVREPGVQLEIVSHTAGSGDAAKDLTLSKRRADAIKGALVDREVTAGRLTATGRGSEEPLAPNITRSGRKMNERVELRLPGPDKPAR